MTTPEMTALQRAIGQLRQCVGVLRSQYGDSTHVRRIANDIERLEIDATDLAGQPTPPKPRDGRGGKPDVVVVPDTPYDPALWAGADDEGVGGVKHHHR
jgi:hypothetical protein